MGLFRKDNRPGAPSTPEASDAALAAILRVGGLVSTAPSLDEAVRRTLDAATELLGAPQGSIMLLEDDGSALILVASVGSAGRALEGSRLPVGESVAGRVIATGRPLLLETIDTDAFFNFIPKAQPVSSSVVVPMRVEGRSIGVLSIGRYEGRPFAAEDLPLAQLFADQAAGLLYRAKLHEQSEQRSAALRALLEASRRLTGVLEVDQLLQHVLEGGTTIAGGNEGFVCLFDPSTGAPTTGVYRGLVTEQVKEVLERDETRSARDDLGPATFEHPSFGRLVAIGLRGHQGNKGVLVVAADATILHDRLELLRAFAQQCGTALAAAEVHTLVERKEAELSSIVQAAPNPIVVVDGQGGIMALNAAAEQVFGVSSVFSVGAPAQELLGHSEIARLLTAPEEFHGEISAGTPPRVYKVSVGDLHAPGAGPGRVLMMDDVTSEREIIQTQRDFVAMIGHELRTPLTVVKGFARTLLRRIDRVQVDELRDGLSTIEDRARQLERLIEDLLYVSGIESREAALRAEGVEFRALVGQAVEDLLRVHPDRQVEVDVPSGLVWVCDKTKIGLVLHHLLENAFKYSNADQPVRVAAYEEGDTLRVDVVDRGVGILSSDIPNLFQRFGQFDASSTREQGGMGVGLYLTSQLIRMHGGRIWADSTWGKGSKFSFSLPRVVNKASELSLVGGADAVPSGISRPDATLGEVAIRDVLRERASGHRESPRLNPTDVATQTNE